EERPRDVEIEAVAERPEDVDRSIRLKSAERPRAGPDRIDEERELSGRRLAETHGSRKHAPRRLEHEELSRNARFEASPSEPEQHVRADRLVRHDGQALATGVHAWIPMRSCSDSADSALALAIACTAAAAPEIVVTHGTRATSAASRM